MFAGNFLTDRVICEDIVQSVFLRFWKEREKIRIESSLKSFLLRSVQNSCFDEIRHQNTVHEHRSHVLRFSSLFEADTENYILYSDLYDRLTEALEKMPQELRETFELSRMDGLKYREIARQLNISERTVESRISKAVQFLKRELKNYLLLFIFF